MPCDLVYGMDKKRLSNLQLKRLRDNQQKLLDNEQINLADAKIGRLITHNNVKVFIKDEAGNLIHCNLRRNLEPLATGDEVLWCKEGENSGVVVALKPRRSVIIRPDAKKVKPVAANVDLIIIVIAANPMVKETTIDRYLCLSAILNIKPIVVVNKIDLLAKDEKAKDFHEKLKIYEQLGYNVLPISTKTKQGIKKLENLLKNKTSILMGQSGVGKSSLLNTLIPDAQALVDLLSQENNLGRQTTTFSKLYDLPFGGHLIDSPGIHQFSLKHFSKEQIIQSFIDFLPFLGKCKFRNCKHINEQDCALLNAVKEGKISSARLNNFHKIISELDG